MPEDLFFFYALGSILTMLQRRNQDSRYAIPRYYLSSPDIVIFIGFWVQVTLDINDQSLVIRMFFFSWYRDGNFPVGTLTCL